MGSAKKDRGPGVADDRNGADCGWDVRILRAVFMYLLDEDQKLACRSGVTRH